jgi:hypothetical protein
VNLKKSCDNWNIGINILKNHKDKIYENIFDEKTLFNAIEM